jgi:hypothetical protein
MKALRFLLPSLIALLTFAPTAQADDPPAQGPIDIARQYTRLYEEGRFGEAFERWWNFETFQKLLFQKDLDGITAKERHQMAERFGYLLPKIISGPQAGQALREATYTHFEEKKLSQNVVAVRFLVRFTDGRGIPNTIILHQLNKQWHIVNQGPSGEKLLAGKLRDEYFKSKMKPQDYVQALVKEAEKQ